MSKKLNLAVAGLGTVGSNFVKIFEKHQKKISQIAKTEIQIIAIAEKKQYKNGIDTDKYRFYTDLEAMAADSDIDIVIELIGGTSDFLFKFLQNCLKNGKHVITANKAMIAKKGMAIIDTAISSNRQLRYEAAVLGTVPIILPLMSSALPLSPLKVLGIFNGTCNYILTEMAKTKNNFADILTQAQKLGYAEAEPGLDIEGYDAAHKLTILSCLVFASRLDLNSVNIEGIKSITPLDLEIAKKYNYTIKLLASSQMQGDKIISIVAPRLIASNHCMARIDGTINAVQICDSISGSVFFSGHGAGGKQTANAVISDVISIAQGTDCNVLRNKFTELKTIQSYDISLLDCRYYLRFMLKDKSDKQKIEQLLLADGVVLQDALLHLDDERDKIAAIFICDKIKTKYLRKTINSISEQIQLEEAAVSIMIYEDES